MFFRNLLIAALLAGPAYADHCSELLADAPAIDAAELFWRHRLTDDTHERFLEWFEEQEWKVQSSVVRTVQALENGESLRNLPRVVATSERGIWEIKPQGRTQSRVMLGVGTGGFRILMGGDGLKNRASDQMRAIRAAARLWNSYLPSR